MSLDTPLAVHSARDSRGAAAARSHAIPPPPHIREGPPATARAESPHREGPAAITSPQGALVGYGRIDILLPHRGSGPRAHPRGKPTGATTAATTTITGPGRSRQGARGVSRGVGSFVSSSLGVGVGRRGLAVVPRRCTSRPRRFQVRRHSLSA